MKKIASFMQIFVLVLIVFISLTKPIDAGCDMASEDGVLTTCDIRIKLCKCRCQDLEVSEPCIEKCDMKGDRCKDMEIAPEFNPNAKLRKQGGKE
eukprot:g7798.t1